MIQGERENLIGCEPRAVLVYHTKAIGIPVQPEGEVCFAAADTGGGFGHSLGIGLRRLSAEEGIRKIMESCDLYAGVFQHCIEVAAARAVHQFYGDLELGFLNGLEINELSDALEVRRHRIDLFARVGANDAALELPVLGLPLGDMRLNFPGNL